MVAQACKFSQQRQHSQVALPADCQLDVPLVVNALQAGNESEILSAIAAPSLTNVIMAGLMSDNGFLSPLNRGRFYTCRSKENQLEGVALIGHTILMEAFSEGAIEAFATVARQQSSPHLLMGEHTLVQRFWKYYADKKQTPRLICPVLFLRRGGPFEGQERITGLRPGRRDDLEHVVRAQAGMAHETSGVDPLKKDPIGFRERYLRRIEKERVWVLMKDGRLVFKADIIADTPQASYIEGVYVSPEDRSKGLGRSCLVTLGQIILERTKAIYLFVENENSRTTSFYLKLGFSVAGQYDLLYF